MKGLFLVLFLLANVIGINFAVSQSGVSINTTGAAADSSAMLDVGSSSKGILIPRVALVSTTDITTIKSPAISLLVFNTNAAMTGGGIGYWYFDGSIWKSLTGSGTTANNAWLTTGNSGTNVRNFVGTTDDASLRFRTNNNAQMIIDSLGNVGVGRAIPLTTLAATKTLDVAGTIMAEGGINKGPTNIPLFRWLPVMMTTYSGTGQGPDGIAFDGTNMWTADINNSSVTKITPTGTMTTYRGTGGNPSSIAFDGTNMWTVNFDRSVTKVTPTGVMTTYKGTGSYPSDIAFDGNNMWTANGGDNSVTKITPNGTMTTYSGTGSDPLGIAFDGTNMWTVNQFGNSVTKITSSGVMTTYSGTGNYPQAIAFDGTNMWTANSFGSVTKIKPTGEMITYNGTGDWSIAIAYDGTNMWTANYYGKSVTKITPSGKIITYNGIESYPESIAFDGTYMWTANKGNGYGNSVTKILVNRGY